MDPLKQTGAPAGLRRSRSSAWNRWWTGALLASSLILLGSPATRAAEGLIATAGVSTAVLSGAHYVEATAFLGRYGLSHQRLTPSRARFGSAWTKIELEADKREMTFNGLRLFLGDPVVAHRKALWVSRLDAEKLLGPLLKPDQYAGTARRPRIIVVDAGHGGQDTGTRNKVLKLDEKDFTLDVARRLAGILERQGFTVVMTRSDDRYLGLKERAEIAQRANADLFVSIHFNSVEKSPAVRGSETYILTPRYQRSTAETKSSDDDRQLQPGNAGDAWNAMLGMQVQRHLLDQLDTFDRGLKRARFAVLRLVECPAVLVEAGYLSNEDEARKIATAEYRAAIAEAIANGIAAYDVQVAAAAARR